jgi:hypothetical protein
MVAKHASKPQQAYKPKFESYDETAHEVCTNHSPPYMRSQVTAIRIFWFLYLVQRSVETTYYTVNGHCSCRPANIRFFRPGIFKRLKCTECFHY